MDKFSYKYSDMRETWLESETYKKETIAPCSHCGNPAEYLKVGINYQDNYVYIFCPNCATRMAVDIGAFHPAFDLLVQKWNGDWEYAKKPEYHVIGWRRK